MHQILFIHGTGVRREGYEATLRTIERQLGNLGEFHVQGCLWGEHHGATLGSRSVPLYDTSKAIEATQGASATANRTDTTTAWQLLLQDPLLEIRLLERDAGRAGEAFDFGPEPLGPRERLDAALHALQQGALALDKDSQRALEESIGEGGRYEGLDTFWSAAHGNTKEPQEAIAVLARSVAAGWLLRLYEGGLPVPAATERDRLVERLETYLGAEIEKGFVGAFFETLLSPVSFLASSAGDLALRTGTWGSRYYRKTITDAASLRAGDVLLYQARGEEIRNCIRESVDAIHEPVILLAHSLGGIACVDWLLSEGCPSVRGLVTVGSQAPFLYEIGALWSLPRGAPPTRLLPPWLNVYDKNDLLSFLAQPLFPGVRKDLELKSGQPFPLSHGAYWTDAQLWRELADFAAGLGA